MTGVEITIIVALTIAGSIVHSLLATGNFGMYELELLLLLLPGVAIGLVASTWVRPHLDASWFRPLVLCIALAGGVGLVIRQLL